MLVSVVSMKERGDQPLANSRMLLICSITLSDNSRPCDSMKSQHISRSGDISLMNALSDAAWARVNMLDLFGTFIVWQRWGWNATPSGRFVRRHVVRLWLPRLLAPVIQCNDGFAGRMDAMPLRSPSQCDHADDPCPCESYTCHTCENRWSDAVGTHAYQSQSYRMSAWRLGLSIADFLTTPIQYTILSPVPSYCATLITVIIVIDFAFELCYLLFSGSFHILDIVSEIFKLISQFIAIISITAIVLLTHRSN